MSTGPEVAGTHAPEEPTADRDARAPWAERPTAAGPAARPGGGLGRFRAWGLSTQVYLILLVIALIGPGLVFTAILLSRYAATERARFEQDARETVRGVALSIDRDTAGLISVLQTLATSPRLREGDVTNFEPQARLVKDAIGLDLTLRRPDGRQVLNTAQKPGTALPTTALPFDREIVSGSQRAMVSSFLTPPLVEQAGYAIGVPVRRDEGVGLVLGFTVPLSRVESILEREQVSGWTTGVADRDRIMLARVPLMEGVTGSERLGTLRQKPAGTPGVWEGTDRQGRPVVLVEARSRLTGWTVAASIPRDLVDARVHRWVWAFSGFGLLVLATSSALAVHLWSRVSRPLRQLAASGPALTRGEAIPRIASPIREIRRLGDVLTDASLRLRTRSAERDEALAETRRGLSALRESEARFRHMADSAPALIWMTDAASQIVFANLHFDHLFGRPAAEFGADGWQQILHPPDLDAFRDTFTEAFEQRRPFRAEMRVVDRNGDLRWLRCEGVPRLDDDGTFLGYTGCNVDVTDAKRAEEHLLLLIHELNHRVKNTLATVQSIALQSLRGLIGEEAAAARAAFEARLLALARAHDVLTRENWDGAELRAIVADAIRPLDPGKEQPARFDIEGPRLRLSPRLALSIAMALHELGTNAVKYGALSREGGRVRIGWGVTRGETVRLRLEWRESGGPSVAPPTRRGFGSRLLERSLARELAGKVALRYEPEGVVCIIEAPVPPPGTLDQAEAPHSLAAAGAG